MMKYSKPTLLLNKNKCLQNINAMAKRAAHSKVRFRPHFKTHQSRVIGKWFFDAGVRHITVSSVSMANYFAGDGWKDISIAIPFNINEIDTINELERDISINLLVSSVETAKNLVNLATREIGCYIKIDTGYGRCGFTLNETNAISEVINILQRNPLLEVKGLLSHFGHTYQARSPLQVKEIYTSNVRTMLKIKDYCSGAFPNLEISVGDTPSCSLLTDFMDVTEIRPGNFIFYDMMQEQIGSCTSNQIAVGLVCPVIEIKSSRNEAIIYGGAIHLSKDYLLDQNGNKNYGAVCLLQNDTWSSPIENCFVKSLSQEHGVISMNTELSEILKPGDHVVILPVHSCLTSSAMQEYYTVAGEKIKMMNWDIRDKS